MIREKKCYAPLNLWTVCGTSQPINSTESPALFKSPLTAGALDSYSGKRSSTVFWCGVYQIDSVGFLHPTD